MAKKVREYIINEVRNRKYYSIIVDSTPNISHCDQLAFILRYVNNIGVPKERFIEFIPKVGHTFAEIVETVLKTIEHYEINISDCRGQSFDTAKNMAGCFNGLKPE